jgi:dCTP deaminase
MILSNSEILKAIKQGHIIIDPSPDIPSFNKPDSPFNTTALDLRLGNIISIPKGKQPIAYDLRKGGIASFLKNAYETHFINPEGGFNLEPQKFVLSNTMEKVHFPIIKGGPCYGARVEGKSSYARIGLLIHFTAPTIHAGFNGTITLELMNFGKNSIVLYQGIYICQLIF